MHSTFLDFIDINRTKLINYLIVFYAFVLSFPAEIKRVIIILMIILWLTDKKRFKIDYYSSINKKIFITFSIFISLHLISFLWSCATFIEIASYIRKYWYYLPIFIIFKYIKREYIIYSLTSFLLGMFISEILSYGNFLGIWAIGYGNKYDPTVFIQHSLYGIFLSLTAIILFLKVIFSNVDKIKKVAFSIFFITVTINIFINSGRTGYITFLASMLMVAFIIFKTRIKHLLLTIFLLLIFIASAYNLSSNFHHRSDLIIQNIQRAFKQKDYYTSIGSRVGLFYIGSKIFMKNPILGVGVACHIKTKNRYITDNNLDKKFAYVKKLVHFHDYFLEIATQLGIIGLSLFLYLLYLIYKIEIKDLTLKIVKTSVLIILILGSFVDMVFYLNATMSLFAFFIGIILAQNRFENEKNITR